MMTAGIQLILEKLTFINYGNAGKSAAYALSKHARAKASRIVRGASNAGQQADRAA
jgi:hypothetical protein